MPSPNPTLLLKGTLTITPSPVSLCESGGALVTSSFEEMISVDAQDTKLLTLTVDVSVPIDLSLVPEVNVLQVRCDQKIDLIITTADGALQVIPVDSIMVWVSKSVPITALSLIRVPGTLTNVRLILAQQA